MNYLTEKTIDLVVDDAFWEIDDFFELIRYTTNQKYRAFDRIPYIREFSLRMFYPSHRNVSDTVNRWIWNQVDELTERYFGHVRRDKFREGIELSQIMRMMVWLADGYLHEQRALGNAIDFDDLLRQFNDWCDMLKLWAYRSEWQ